MVLKTGESVEIIGIRKSTIGRPFISFNLVRGKELNFYCQPYLNTLDKIGIKCFIFLTFLASIEEKRENLKWADVTGRIVSDIDEKIGNEEV